MNGEIGLLQNDLRILNRLTQKLCMSLQLARTTRALLQEATLLEASLLLGHAACSVTL